MARLRTRREVVVADGAEIVDDSVAVLEGQHVARRFREVEVELLDGDERTLRRLEKQLRKAGARPSARSSPSSTARSTSWVLPRRRRARRARRRSRRLATLSRATTERCSRTTRARAAATIPRISTSFASRRGGCGPSCAPRGRSWTRDWAESLREELGWLGGHLGPARDLDVMLGRFRAEVGSLGADGEGAAGLLEALEDERAAAYRDVGETLQGDRYYALLDRLEAAGSPPPSGEETPLAKIFDHETKRMRRKFDDLGDDPEDDALHEARIGVKRARYAADLAAHELGQAGEHFVSIAKKLQDILGDHQDAVVAQTRIRDWAAANSPASGFAAGRLVQLERDRMAAARARLARRVAQARPGCAQGGLLTRSSARRAASSSEAAGTAATVLVVHRPGTTTGRFPKGKAEPGESDEDCAVREVEEETGLRCSLGRELPATEYIGPKQRPKKVRYWEMEIVGGSLRFEHEVDDARWLAPGEAASLLSYARDVDVLRAAVERETRRERLTPRTGVHAAR